MAKVGKVCRLAAEVWRLWPPPQRGLDRRPTQRAVPRAGSSGGTAGATVLPWEVMVTKASDLGHFTHVATSRGANVVLVFCTACGAFGSARARRLAEQCSAVASTAGKHALRMLAAGKHPVRARRVGVLVTAPFARRMGGP